MNTVGIPMPTLELRLVSSLLGTTRFVLKWQNIALNDSLLTQVFGRYFGYSFMSKNMIFLAF